MTASWPRWLLVGLIALEAILLATGRISLGAAIALIGAVEVAVTLILMVVGWRATRGFEGPFLDRLEIGIAAVAGGVVARLMVTEFRMLGSLMPGLRGDMRLPPKSIAIPYARGRWAAPALFGFAALAWLAAAVFSSDHVSRLALPAGKRAAGLSRLHC